MKNNFFFCSFFNWQRINNDDGGDSDGAVVSQGESINARLAQLNLHQDMNQPQPFLCNQEQNKLFQLKRRNLGGGKGGAGMGLRYQTVKMI